MWTDRLSDTGNHRALMCLRICSCSAFSFQNQWGNVVVVKIVIGQDWKINEELEHQNLEMKIHIHTFKAANVHIWKAGDWHSSVIITSDRLVSFSLYESVCKCVFVCLIRLLSLWSCHNRVESKHKISLLMSTVMWSHNNVIRTGTSVCWSWCGPTTWWSAD